MGANPESNRGPAARSIARIPLGAGLSYRLAIYLMVDYTWDLIMTPSLNIYIAGNYYNSSNYNTVIQKLAFSDKVGQIWGSSEWIRLPGIILNYYQMH